MNKILGGKSKKLKCVNCGNLRYPKVELCPKCFYKKLKFFICKITLETQSYINDKEKYVLLEGININHAMYKAGYKDSYGQKGYISWIPSNIKEFDYHIDAINYYNSLKGDENK